MRSLGNILVKRWARAQKSYESSPKSTDLEKLYRPPQKEVIISTSLQRETIVHKRNHVKHVLPIINN